LNKLSDYLRISEAAKIVAHRHPTNGYRLFKQEGLDALLKQVQAPDVTENKTSKKPRLSWDSTT